MKFDQPILVTGAAGFIGFHVSKRLLQDGNLVVGLDSVNDYYDVNLKRKRIDLLKESGKFHFEKLNLANKPALLEVFNKHKFEYVVHLAAQAGVRHSFTHPEAYVESNLTAFVNVLEASKTYEIKHLVYASSSSVYGANTKMPFSVADNVDHPLSLYAATKKANELMAHSYATVYKLPSTGLRFFSAYGPWGRPDMALFLFTKAILNNEPIEVFNDGKMKRDFTYVDDVVEGVCRLIPEVAKPDPEWNSEEPNVATSFAPYRIYNIGNNSPVNLMDFIRLIEAELGKKAKINFLPLQKGDVPIAYADVADLHEAIDYKPSTSIEKGVRNFIQWYKEYYKI